MTPEEAFDLVARACATLQANLATHTEIQKALVVLQELITAAPSTNGKKASART